MPRCLIGLGSNLGSREENLLSVVRALAEHSFIEVRRVSRNYATKPIGGPTGQGEFLNAAVTLDTSLTADELLQLLQDTENLVGRTRQLRWEPRLVDLDLLLYGPLVIRRSSLRIPHPWMAVRPFVLVPAAEIAGEMLHPEIQWTVAELLQHVQHRPQIVLLLTERPGRAANLTQTLTARASYLPLFRGESEIGPDDFEHQPLSEVLERRLARQNEIFSSDARFTDSNTGPVIVDDWWDDPLRMAMQSLDGHAVLESSQQPPEVRALFRQCREGNLQRKPPQVTVAVYEQASPESQPGSAAARGLNCYLRRPDAGPFLELFGADDAKITHDLQAVLDGFESVLGAVSD